MKKLILLSGPMGVGKSTVSEALNQKLTHSVYLDGDWCWAMDPFIVNEENKKMVMRNIQFLLQAFIDNSSFEHIIFCWVMHQQAIIDDVLKGLNLNQTEVISISLIATPERLAKNIQPDIKKGFRASDALEKSVERLKFYEKVNTIKIDRTQQTTEETVAAICALLS